MKTPATSPKPDRPASPPGIAPPGISWGALSLACALALGLSIYPRPLIGPDGRADHGTLMLLIWAMIAGLVRGVGFIPRNRVLHVLLSAPAAYAAFLAACLMLYFTHAPV